MTTQLELTDAELFYLQCELIEHGRAEQASIEERKALERDVRDKKIRLAAERRATARKVMINKLRDADENNLIFQTEKGGDFQVFFSLNGKQEEIAIEDHIARSGGWRMAFQSSGTNKGPKYRLTGAYNNYAQRYYKNPKSLIKKIEEFQLAASVKQAREIEKKDLAGRSLEQLRADYPNATVTFFKGHDGNRLVSSPDRYKVETENGSYTFTSHWDRSQGDVPVISFSVYNRIIGKNIEDKVREMILG